MLGNVIRNATGVVDGVLGLVNTGITATACGLNTLNQEIKEITEPEQLTEAQKFLQQPSMAMEFLNQNKPARFGKVRMQPNVAYERTIVYEGKVAIKDGDDIYCTELDASHYNLVIECMHHAKNVLTYLATSESGMADYFPLTNGKVTLILWNNLQDEPSENIEQMALVMLRAIEEVNA